jgi:hypothetical protein
MEQVELLPTLIQEGPLAVLVGYTIYQLTRVYGICEIILRNQEMLIKRMLNDPDNRP